MDGMKLSFPPESPPLSVIVALSLSASPVTIDSSSASAATVASFVFSDGRKLSGTTVLLRYVGRSANKLPGFYGNDAFDSSQIDEWLDYASVFSSGSEFENACGRVDKYLETRTFLVGHSLSIADVAIWSALAGTGQRWESLRKSKKYQSLVRWFNSILDEYGELLNKVLATYVKKGSGKPVAAPKSKDSQQATTKADAQDKGKPEVDLPEAEIGKVRLRFAPEPSGYLHIGHAKAALLNKYFAERYQGEVIVRFDDTNPAKESNEFVDNLVKDIGTLGIKYEKVTYTSDYFPELMEMAEKLMREGKAYVDDTPREQMQKERMDGIDSKCRNHSVDENLKLWKEMIKGSERGLQCCVRGKFNMQDPNKAMRDPVYYRCNPMSHHRIGDKYKIYPTYDFACPFVDSLEGITHALRSSEYHDRNAQYFKVLDDMGMRQVQLYEFSRLNLVFTLLSKRKLLWFVQSKLVDGWDDPRFPTVQGIVRRGLKIEALIQFILEQGASKNLNLMEWDKLWSINKRIIDPVCPRHTAVIAERRVLFTLTDGPDEPFVRMIPKHKKFEGAGEKATTFTKSIWMEEVDASAISVGEEVTLMDWGNAIVKEITKDEEGHVTALSGVLNLQGSVKTTKLKLTWLPDTNELVNLTLTEFDYLITKKKLEDDDEVADFVNPNTKKETLALGDSNMRNLKCGDVIQLERKGYFRCDVPFVKSSKPIVLFSIPDGRAAK
ncbi:PREDICTED: glutamate--tRNA ligase, cytoplasmic [Camelina sativa]|uniref:glutamate--tRNA ligase n=1 Tax=Camelina sativa TaxID=90675 RepID=A0ABM0T6B2_CAMSA|nr:PREDICTED: glutamate--tRNA ligase, cytoplasmic [Camelina sativa]